MASPPLHWKLCPGRYGTEGELLLVKGGRIAVGGARWNSFQIKDGPRTQSYKAYLLLPGFKETEQQSDHESMEQAKSWVEHHFREWLVAVGLLQKEAPEPLPEEQEEPPPAEAPRKTFKAFRKPEPPQAPKRPSLQRR